jgi:1-acyl-sn-glycerol-3-phosphate acyltransferase
VVRAARLVASVLTWTLALPLTALLGLVATVLGVIPRLRDRALWIARLWARLCLLITGCRLAVSGAANIDPEQRYVIMANHQSALDIPVLLAVLPVPLRITFWAKKSLFSIPVLGWAMLAMGYIPIDRVQRANAVGMFLDSLDISRQGRSVLVFPEETYARGETLLPFQRGGFLFAIKTGLPILPIGIEGTRIALAPGSRMIEPSVISVRIGEPLPTGTLKVSDRRQLTGTVRTTLIELAGAARDSNDS